MAQEYSHDDLLDDLEEDNLSINESGINDLIGDELSDPDDLDLIDEEGFVNESEDDMYVHIGNDPGDSIYSGDDDEVDEDGNPIENTGNDSDLPSIVESKIINDLLQSRGIQDPRALQYLDENDEVVEVDFYSLPYEDQVEILKTDTTVEEPTFTEDELGTIELLRQNNATLEDVLEYTKRQAIEEYLREQNGQNFMVDDYDDNELFLMDLQLKYEDWTEEELQIELEKELQYEELFKKKVDRLRKEYVELEIQSKEQEQVATQQKELEAFQDLSNSLIEVAVKVEDIGGLAINDDDKNLVLDTVLNKNINGVSKFHKMLEQPDSLFKLAWFAEKGEEAFAMIHDYYIKQIDVRTKAAYAKGKDEAKPKTTTSGKVSAVRANTSKSNGKKVASIDDLH